MKDHRFVIRMNSEEKNRWKALAKERGKVGLSPVIDELIRLWERNPSILDPNELESASSEILSSIRDSFSDFPSLDARLRNIEDSLTQIKRALNLVEPDKEHEAAFEEE